MTAKILVVDDEAKIVKLVRSYLEQAGFAVVEAADGQTALIQARREQPDLIVLDLGLPGLDGLEVTRTLRRERMYYEQYAEDAELFAQYPVVTQQELSPAHAPRPNRKGRFVQEDAQVIKEGRGRGIRI